MTATAGPGHLAGFLEAQIMFRDANGYPKGTLTVPDTVTPGTTTHAYLCTGPVSSTLPSITREVAKFFGGQTILGQLALGVSDFGTSELVLSAYDEVLNAYITGSVADAATHTSHVFTAPNVNNISIPQFILMLTMYWQSYPGGVNKFMTLVYPNCQVYPPGFGPNQSSGTNPNPANHTIVPTQSTRLHTGELVSATTLGLVNNSDLFFMHRSDNKLGVTTWVADGALTTFTLGYRPVSSDATNAINIVTKNGVKVNPTSISTTTGAVVIAAAGSSGDIWEVVYPTNRVTI